MGETGNQWQECWGLAAGLGVQGSGRARAGQAGTHDQGLCIVLLVILRGRASVHKRCRDNQCNARSCDVDAGGRRGGGQERGG